MIRSRDWEQNNYVRKSAALAGIDITETRANASKSLPFGLSESTIFTSSTDEPLEYQLFFYVEAYEYPWNSNDRKSSISFPRGGLSEHQRKKKASFGCVHPPQLYLRFRVRVGVW